MKVVLFNTYTCCHTDEFVGVFENEELAKEAIIARAKKHKRTGDEFWLESYTVYCSKNEYELWRNCKYKDVNNNNEVFYKKETTREYYQILDLDINEYY